MPQHPNAASRESLICLLTAVTVVSHVSVCRQEVWPPKVSKTSS